MDFKQNCSLRSFQDGVQVDLWSLCGVHVESVGEGKVQLRDHKRLLIDYKSQI